MSSTARSLLQLNANASPFGPLCDTQWHLHKRIIPSRGFQAIIGENMEGELKALFEFILPLLYEIAGGNNQAVTQITTNKQFFDEQTRHNRLACAWVIGKQKTEGLFASHRFVDHCDLARQWLDQRGMHGDKQVKKISKMNTIGF